LAFIVGPLRNVNGIGSSNTSGSAAHMLQ